MIAIPKSIAIVIIVLFIGSKLIIDGVGDAAGA